eukprot:8325585-Ditylum_brightwellii.AAC.1
MRMGNIIRRSNVTSGPSGLKVESQMIVDLSGKEYTDRMRNQSKVFSSQLHIAILGGTAYYLVKQHDEDKD